MQKSSKPLWSGRFKKPLHADARRFSTSIAIDSRLYEEDIDGSIAHVTVLSSIAIVSEEECATIVAALREIKAGIAAGAITFSPDEEDIHLAIERLLIERVGEIGGKLHTARSRNDQVALDERLYLKKHLFRLQQLIRSLQRALTLQAAKHCETVMPGYTHMQRAQPVLLGHHLLAYVAMFDRDHERLADCLSRVDRSPLGASAFAGTSYPIDRKQTAALLGLGAPMINSIDAVSSRDHLIEAVSACSILMMHESRLAEELVLWASAEFGFVQMDDAVSTGSSIMPQKKNPDMAELVRGKTGKVYGALISLLTTMKGLPLAYNRDMQEDKEPLFAALNTASDCTSIMRLVIDHCHFQCERMKLAANDDSLLATEVADYLVRKGMPFRMAHHTTGELIVTAEQRGQLLRDLDLSTLQQVSPLFTEDIKEVFSPEASIRGKQSSGSTSYASVKEQITFWNNKFGVDESHA